ncbi:MAG: fructose-6-phosphate aldolase [Candidatus Dadabacteria bacterium]|nr:fructose-6-phosphate aldolase [Candidatus Dadabacteria bacterium]NIS08287.1 fructose-6-phosphate aldolase [Candidatus Dadabacteria bacterium]NIV41571.1 fructose-6-phosphate aldolase [Candidatus Dadabacteria bacterium]NIY21778.1 fructose-6-phosphate aldolase [Candidatus Dadabacteria bacterium]
MEFFLDTANLDEIRDCASYGILDGVTTNPSLVSKEGEQKGFKELVKEICEIVDGPVSAEVLSTDVERMISEARELAEVDDRIVVKMPLTDDGIKATKIVSDDGINVNVTLCFSATQALIAAKAGAAYISPFVGRLDDISESGMQLIRDIVKIYDNYDFKTKILVASVRHPDHMLESAKAGAHVATMPYKVFKQMFKHPLTDIGLEKFLADWGKVKS